MVLCGQINFQSGPLPFLDTCSFFSGVMIKKFKLYLLILSYYNDTVERQVSSDCQEYIIWLQL